MSQLRLRTDDVGYVLDGNAFDGFPDQPELPDRQRLRIARWGERFAPDRLEEAQRQLLEQPTPSRRSSSRQRELAANRQVLAELQTSGLWEALSTEQREWVVRPGTHRELPNETRYPLTVGQLGRLSGATERQLRWWVDGGLVPAIRDGKVRRVYSGGAAWALLLASLHQPEKTVLRRVQEGASPIFLHLLSATVQAWSTGNLALDDQRRVEQACQQMAWVAQRMSGASAGDAPDAEEPVGWRLPEKPRLSPAIFESFGRRGESVEISEVYGGALEELFRKRPVRDSSVYFVALFLGSDAQHRSGAEELMREALAESFGIAFLPRMAYPHREYDTDMTIVHTVPHDKGWANKVEGNARVSNVAPTKAEAERLGRELAMRKGAVHLVHGKDGRIQHKRLYSHARVK